MKKLLLVFIVLALSSFAYAMCPRMAGCRGNANYKRMTECEYRNECPKVVNGNCIASNSNCYGTECPFK